MKIRLKKGMKLSPIKNKYGLDLGDFYNLQAGKMIEIKDVSELKDIVDEIKEKK
jgi:hypothetical protein